MSSANGLQDYYFHGFRLRSTIPLATVPLWPASQEETTPQLHFLPGEVPAALTDPVWSSPFVQVGQDRAVLVTIAAVGRFWLPDGERILFERSAGAPDFELETVLTGTVAGLILHQRHLLPLHASCVLLNGRGVLLGGVSSQGKSALAAALIRRGALLLADDVCTLQNGQKGISVAAASTHLRLWPDVMSHLQIAPEQQFSTRLNHPKKAVLMPAAEARLWPLHFLVRLRTDHSDCPWIEAQTALDTIFPPPLGLSFLPQMVTLMGDREVEFRSMAMIARGTRRFLFKRPRLMDHFEACADLIESSLEGQ